ncbi:hypothetical protein HDU84_006536 [Entophlyctis sp. JEL0112]|nr:hypothetical protein HDU84_006536 [Entophlyctis sp. JEL0112]
MSSDTTPGRRRRASSFDPYAQLLENVRGLVKSGLLEKRVATAVNGKHDAAPPPTDEAASLDDLGWEFSDADDGDSSDERVSPLPFRSDLQDVEQQGWAEIAVGCKESIGGMSPGPEPSLPCQEQLEREFHGELEKANMFIEIHEGFFRRRSQQQQQQQQQQYQQNQIFAEIEVPPCARTGVEGEEENSDTQLLQDILAEAGIEGLSVAALEQLATRRTGEARRDGTAAAAGLARFMPRHVPELFEYS